MGTVQGKKWLLAENEGSGFRKSWNKSMKNLGKKAEKPLDEALPRKQEINEEDKQDNNLRQRTWLSFLFLSEQFWEESTKMEEFGKKRERDTTLKKSSEWKTV